jgi:hypothetical protein
MLAEQNSGRIASYYMEQQKNNHCHPDQNRDGIEQPSDGVVVDIHGHALIRP